MSWEMSRELSSELSSEFRAYGKSCKGRQLVVSLVVLWRRSIYGGSSKTHRFDCVQVSKLKEVSYEMLVLTLPLVSSYVSVAFLWRRSIYGGSSKTRRF